MLQQDDEAWNYIDVLQQSASVGLLVKIRKFRHLYYQNATPVISFDQLFDQVCQNCVLPPQILHKRIRSRHT